MSFTNPNFFFFSSSITKGGYRMKILLNLKFTVHYTTNKTPDHGGANEACPMSDMSDVQRTFHMSELKILMSAQFRRPPGSTLPLGIQVPFDSLRSPFLRRLSLDHLSRAPPSLAPPPWDLPLRDTSQRSPFKSPLQTSSRTCLSLFWDHLHEYNYNRGNVKCQRVVDI